MQNEEQNTDKPTGGAGRKSVIDKQAFFRALQENPTRSQRSLRSQFGGSPANIKTLYEEFFKSNSQAVEVIEPENSIFSNEKFTKGLMSLIALVQEEAKAPLQKTADALMRDNAELQEQLEDQSQSYSDYENEIEEERLMTQKEISLMQDQIASYETITQEKDTQINVLKQSNADLQTSLTKSQKDHTETVSRLATAEAEKKKADELLDATRQTLTDVRADLAAAEQSLTETNTELKAVRVKLEEERTKREADQAETKKVSQDLAKEVSKNGKLEAERDSAVSQLTESKSRETEYKTEIKSLKDELALLRKELKEAKKPAPAKAGRASTETKQLKGDAK